MLTRVFPPELVDGVVAESGRTERRHRLLPARVVVYYVLALALFADSSYEEVMRQLVEGLSWESGWRSWWEVPSKVAIYKARQRLGREPLELLFRAVARPLASEATQGAFYRGLRLVSLDGTCLDVADTEANVAEFGRPGSSRREGGGGFPQLRLVGLAESGTHAIFDAALGPYRVSEQELAGLLWDSLTQGMLCLADRNFYSFERFQQARGTGAQLLWRVKSDIGLPCEQTLADGSYLTSIHALRNRRARRDGQPARVIEYRLDDPALAEDDQRYRLLTTLLDPEAAPASELAALYPQRWELSQPLMSSKPTSAGRASCSAPRHPTASTRKPTATSPPTTRSAASCTTRRSRPTSSHTAYRSSAASEPPAEAPEPSRDFPPHSLDRAHQQAIAEILAEPLPERRPRQNPRVIKRKMSKWGVKRPHHRNWPQPTTPAEDTITILAA